MFKKNSENTGALMTMGIGKARFDLPFKKSLNPSDQEQTKKNSLLQLTCNKNW